MTPAIRSVRALESGDGERRRRWLRYWAVYGVVSTVSIVSDPLQGLIPGYWTGKVGSYRGLNGKGGLIPGYWAGNVGSCRGTRQESWIHTGVPYGKGGNIPGTGQETWIHAGVLDRKDKFDHLQFIGIRNIHTIPSHRDTDGSEGQHTSRTPIKVPSFSLFNVLTQTLRVTDAAAAVVRRSVSVARLRLRVLPPDPARLAATGGETTQPRRHHRAVRHRTVTGCTCTQQRF